MTRPIRVIPAVLTEDPAALKNMLQLAEKFTDYVQIDIMDGKFVPSRSISWQQMAEIQTKLKWEVHLMVEHPEKQLENFKKAGAQKAIFHYEATPSAGQIIAIARKLELEVGLAVNPETPVSAVLPFTGDVDSVLFLSVHPGFYGAKFVPEVLDKIAELRQAKPDMIIGIDGGIKANNIASVARIGVDEIFVGSAIFLQPDLEASYHQLLNLAQTANR